METYIRFAWIFPDLFGEKEVFFKDWKSNDLVVSMSLGHLCMSPEELIISFVAEQEGKEILDQHASWSVCRMKCFRSSTLTPSGL